MRVLRAGACLAAALALAVGCGGDDADEGSLENGGPGVVGDRRADEQAAAGMLLTLDDFPAGWEERPAEAEEEDDEEVQAGMADCLGIDVAELDPDHPSAKSPRFVSPAEDEVSAEVTLAPSPEEAIRQLEAMKDEATPRCYADAVKAVMARSQLEGEGTGDGAEFGEPTFNRLSFADMGDDSVAFRLTIPVSAGDVTLDFYIDVVVVRVGRVGIATTFLSSFSPFEVDEAARLTQIVVDRVPPL